MMRHLLCMPIHIVLNLPTGCDPAAHSKLVTTRDEDNYGT